MRFKNDRQRKAVMASINFNKYGVTLEKSKGRYELPDPRIGKALSNQRPSFKAKPKNIKPLSKPMVLENRTLDFVVRKGGRFAVPLMFSLAGVDDSFIVAKAGLNSFEESLKVYRKTGSIDDAIISGTKSFVKNYIIDKTENYIVNDFSLLKDSDRKYEAALKGTILMASLYTIIENIK